MDHKTIRILVVEDDPKWSGIITDFLLKGLAESGTGTPSTLLVDADADFKQRQIAYIDNDDNPYQEVEQPGAASIIAVNTMAGAERLIATLPALHMVTMDMELGTPGATEGLLLLEKVLKAHPQAASVVVSGRAGELDIARQSMAHYGAVDAILKGDDQAEIRDSLHATLWYAEAGRLKREHHTGAARALAERALARLDTMTANTRANFKRRFDDLLRDLGEAELDEVSGLLNASVITDRARDLLQSNAPWALGIIVLDGLTAYENSQGAFNRIQTIKTISQQLQHSAQTAGDKVQLGYLGEGKFIVIAGQTATVETINNTLVDWFAKHSLSFYSQLADQRDQNRLSLRFFLKHHAQGFAAIDELLALADADDSQPTSW